MTRAYYVVVAVVVALAAGTVASAFAGDVVFVAILGFLTLFFGPPAVMPWLTQRPGLIHPRSDGHGLVFSGTGYSRNAWTFGLRSTVIGPVLLVVLATSGGDEHVAAPVYSACLILPLLGLAGLRQMRRWRPAEVRLERSQIFVQVPFRPDYSLRWDSVPPLSDPPDSADPIRPLMWMLARDGDAKQRFPEAELSSDPVLVAEIIEFYRANPRLRKELGNGRCIDRIRTGRFRET